MDAIITFFSNDFWLSATVIAAMTTSLTGVINRLLKPNGTYKQIIAWFVSIVLTVGCYFLNLITVAEPAWLTLVLTGFVVGLASNGIYDIPTIRNWVNAWFSNLAPKKD